MPTQQMIEIGNELKKAREKRALTIEQVQKQTYIHKTVLAALEEGRCDEILTATYVKGFLKKYAQFLGLDPKELMKQYAAGTTPAGAKAPPPEPKAPVSQRASAPSPVSPDIVMKILTGIGIGILAVILLYAATRIGTALVGAIGKMRAARVAALPREGTPRKVAAKTAPVEKKRRPAAAAPAEKSAFKMTLTVREQVWVELRTDGVLIFERLVPKGTSSTFSAKEKIEMYVGKIDAVSIAVDGRTQKLSAKGGAKNLEITRKGARIK